MIDFILGVVIVEAVLLIAYWRIAGRGVAPADLIPNLLAGGFLVLALRTVVAGNDWAATQACLAAAGLSHLVDLTRRWRR